MTNVQEIIDEVQVEENIIKLEIEEMLDGS